MPRNLDGEVCEDKSRPRTGTTGRGAGVVEQENPATVTSGTVIL